MLLVGCVCFLVGFMLRNIIISIDRKRNLKKLNHEFKSILDNIDKSVFKSRFSNTVYIECEMVNHGKINIVYMIDKNDIAIFKGDKCILTSTGVDKVIINDIISSINYRHSIDINDIVNIYGIIINRRAYEKALEETNIQLNNSVKELSDIDKIIKNNEMKFNIDDILDKISSVGMESLSQEEISFLEKYSKK